MTNLFLFLFIFLFIKDEKFSGTLGPTAFLKQRDAEFYCFK